MNRQQKELVVKSLQDEFAQSNASFLVGVQGLSVSQMEGLRTALRSKGGRLKVAKARLMKRAIKEADGTAVLEPFLKHQIGVVFAQDQVPAVAKALSDFSKLNEALVLIAGSLENNLLGAQEIIRIASLPSREQLLAQVCGTLKSPIAGFANVLNVLILRLLWTLKQIEEKKKS
jgi:large subunit ribosomal protein L10